MATTMEIGKLAELRQKTDRDLVRMIRTMLERGLILASVATNKQSPLYRQAENLHKEAGVLLSKIYSMPSPERANVTARLLELREALEQVESGEAQCRVAGH